jgi:hypothetical protein
VLADFPLTAHSCEQAAETWDRLDEYLEVLARQMAG